MAWRPHFLAPGIDLAAKMPIVRGAMKPLGEKRHDTIFYSPTGEVCCRVDPFEADPAKAFATMQFNGYEHDRGALKYRCSAAAFGLTCRNRAACQCRPRVRDGKYGRIVRVPLALNPRIFMPTPRHTQGFETAYDKRTAIERVNSRIDQVYGFERHFIRGLDNMKLRVGLALSIMLATFPPRTFLQKKTPGSSRHDGKAMPPRACPSGFRHENSGRDIAEKPAVMGKGNGGCVTRTKNAYFASISN